MISLTIAAPPAFGFTVTGSGFAPNSWIWITVEDLSDNTKPVDGPDAFHPNSDGTFNRVNTTTPLACGHWMQANAFVSDTVVAQSSVVAAPKCPPVPKATAPVGDCSGPRFAARVGVQVITGGCERSVRVRAVL
jgi:hypothetical protein